MIRIPATSTWMSEHPAPLPGSRYWYLPICCGSCGTAPVGAPHHARCRGTGAAPDNRVRPDNERRHLLRRCAAAQQKNPVDRPVRLDRFRCSPRSRRCSCEIESPGRLAVPAVTATRRESASRDRDRCGDSPAEQTRGADGRRQGALPAQRGWRRPSMLDRCPHGSRAQRQTRSGALPGDGQRCAALRRPRPAKGIQRNLTPA